MDSPAHENLDTSLGFEAADEIANASKKKKISYNIEVNFLLLPLLKFSIGMFRNTG